VVAQRVIEKMTAAASQYIADETGEAMIGLVLPGEDLGDQSTITILDTISPDVNAPDVDTVREAYAFQQGGEHQYEAFIWLADNWQYHRNKRQKSYGKANAAKWDMPLRHVGDWHKHPGYMNNPSHGDLLSALDQLDDPDNNMKFLLAPIVTLGQPATVDTTGANVNFLTVPMEPGTDMRVDWYYIHRDTRRFQPINPVIRADDELPGLSEYPWHLKDSPRVNQEFNHFHRENIFYSVSLADIDGQSPLEVCISVARMGSSKIFLMATPWNYPAQPPIVRITPFKPLADGQVIADVFEEWWEKSEPVADPEGWQWSEDKTLYAYLCAVEDALGLRPPPPVVEAADAVEEPIDDEPAADVQPSDDKDVKIEKPTKD
jgi:hypothetical protein